MFETSVVKAQAAPAPRRAGVFTISVVLHTFLIAAAVGVSLASVEFPNDAPNQLELFRVAEPVGIPPALGNPNGGGAKPTVKPAPAVKPVTPTQPTAPAAIPDETPVAESSTASVAAQPGDGAGTSDEPLGRADGVPDGIGIGTPGSGIGTVEAPAPVPDPIYRVGAEVTSARVLRRVDPIYPQAMIRARVPATVTVQCIIDKKGRVRDVQVLRSSFPPFNQAVIDAIEQWTFAPGKLGGEPVDTYFELTARFQVN